MKHLTHLQIWFFSKRHVLAKNKQFYYITQAAYLFGMIAHAMGIPMFYELGIHELVTFNAVFSVPAFLMALILNRRGKHNFAFLWAFLELLFHQVVTTYYLSWDIGAYFWLIYLAGLSFFNSQWQLRTQLSLLTTVIAAFISLFLFCQEGVYAIDINLLKNYYLISGITVFMVLSLLIYYFVSTTTKAELLLKQEQEVTKKMLHKIEGLFGQQVSREIAAEMIDSEKEIESKQYSATIMFLDIRDFTLLADSRPPSEVAHIQNEVFSALIDIIRVHHGNVLQLLGDGLMAVFGAPRANTTHAQDAVNASFDILDKIKHLSEIGHIPKIRVGIGLNTGDIVAGNLGNDTRKSYSITGKNVIIAARIEPLNKKYNSQLLISESVYTEINSTEIETEELGHIPLKGIELPVNVYKLS
ncbi:adenylate/guanylate cyclase domain-containing protein [Flammeovirga sp. SubArs3]|uniref:adenylate/guanylate cyclase domain-containing protein n=1 Tax=Flammeovirga sp. SubArs3 TaxID=2995316 RepID=UPI00248B2BA0|nr:adenylate/guanylate cyclase domain-containing protein [Flammeovirga sp. SubArs3]